MNDRRAMVILKAKCEKEILIAFFGLTAIITSIEAKERPFADIRKLRTINIINRLVQIINNL